MNEQELQLLTQQLADISMPAAPDWQPVFIAIIFVSVFIVTTALMLFFKMKKTSATETKSSSPQERLDALKRAWDSGETNDHDAAYQIATLLRLGLKTNHLNSSPPSPSIDEHTWRNTIQLLQTLRYRNTETRLDETIFQRAKCWLNDSSATC